RTVNGYCFGVFVNVYILYTVYFEQSVFDAAHTTTAFDIFYCYIMYHHLFFFEVLIPKGKYNGQKLMNDVSTNTTAKMPNMIANVPEMTFVKYNAAITIAMSIRIALSAVPIFFFIFSIFLSG